MSSQRNSASGPANSSFQRISFNGTDSEDVTEFVREVDRIALDQGKRRDDEWIIDYAEACLGGKAIRWYSELEDDDITTWKALRRSLLNQFGPPDGKHASQAATARTVPDTPPLERRLANIETTIAGLTTSVSRLEALCTTLAANLQLHIDSSDELIKKMQIALRSYPVMLSGQKGRIKVVEDRTNKSSYLQKRTDMQYYELAPAQADSLIFQLMASESNADRMWMRLVDPFFGDPTDQKVALVLIRSNTDYAFLGFVQEVENQTLQCTVSGWREYPVSRDVWFPINCVGSTELQPRWPGEDGKQIATTNGTVYLWLKSAETCTWPTARLYFEPI